MGTIFSAETVHLSSHAAACVTVLRAFDSRAILSGVGTKYLQSWAGPAVAADHVDVRLTAY